jgi:hypothetical protein
MSTAVILSAACKPSPEAIAALAGPARGRAP